MKRLIIPLILFLFVVLEGVAIDLLPDRFVLNNFLIVPHWVFIMLALVSIYYDTYDTFYAVVYGVIFGLLIDIVYTNILGVYMFAYPLAIYMIHVMKRYFITNFILTMVMTMIGLLIVEWFIVFAYTLTGSIHIVVDSTFFDRILPTTLANMVFLLLMYPICKPIFLRWQKEALGDF